MEIIKIDKVGNDELENSILNLPNLL